MIWLPESELIDPGLTLVPLYSAQSSSTMEHEIWSGTPQRRARADITYTEPGSPYRRAV